MTELTDSQIERYSRHIILADIGGAGQKKLLQSRALVLGAGGLGSPSALYMAAAGVGTIGIADDDVVDLSNLQRQVIHGTEDIGKPKVESARRALTRINPDVKVELHRGRVTSENIRDIISSYDVVLDGTDNFATRFLVNDACYMAGKPLVHGAILGFNGQVMTILPGEGPCYRCIFREPPPPGAVPNCRQAGVLGAIAGIIGTIQATEALKIILGKGETLSGRLLVLDAMDMSFRPVKTRKDPRCPLCGESPTIVDLADYDEICTLG